MAVCKVNNVNIVANACTVVCVIVVSEPKHQRHLAALDHADPRAGNAHKDDHDENDEATGDRGKDVCQEFLLH